MPIGVGYNVLPSQFVDLASIAQRQQAMEQEAVQKRFQSAVGVVSSIMNNMQEQKQQKFREKELTAKMELEKQKNPMELYYAAMMSPDEQTRTFYTDAYNKAINAKWGIGGMQLSQGQLVNTPELAALRANVMPSSAARVLNYVPSKYIPQFIKPPTSPPGLVPGYNPQQIIDDGSLSDEQLAQIIAGGR